MTRLKTTLLAALVLNLLTASSSRAASVPQALGLSGQLFDASGLPVLSNHVDMRVEVLDAHNLCILYSEDHLGLDLSGSAGRFALTLGTGTSPVNNVAGSSHLDASVFTNPGVTAVSNCGSPLVTLAPGDAREIRVSYDLGGGLVALTPNVALVSSANAMIADSLQGKGPADFVQIVDNGTTVLNQTNTQYAFSATNWPRLKALLDGTSAQYLPTTPSTAVSLNGQRLTNLSDPTAAQDAATKNYADTMLAGKAVDVTAVGPMTGTGNVLRWDGTSNKWVASALSLSPTGSASGDLTGTYPGPTIANDVITAAKIKSTGGGVNRLLITDASTGATITYGSCAIGEVYAWSASGWACTSLATAAPVTSVAGRTGAVTLTATDVAGLGTASLLDAGTGAGQVPRLDGTGRLPAVDGSLLTGVNAVQLQARPVAVTAPTPGQVLGWNGSAWLPVSSAGSATNVALSGLTAATAANSIDDANFAQTWAWSTATTQTPLSLTANGLTTGSVLSLSSSSSGLNSAAGVLNVANTGSSSNGVLARLQSNSTAGSGLTVLTNGKVGIGTPNPNYSLDVNGTLQNSGTAYLSSGTYAANAPTVVIGDNQYGLSAYNGGLFLYGSTGFYFNKGGTIVTTLGDGLALGAGYTGTGAPTNGAIIQGLVGVGTTLPRAGLDVNSTGTAASAIIVPRDTVANRPSTPVNGMLRYASDLSKFEAYQGGSWQNLIGGNASSLPLSGLTAATAVNTIDSLNFAQNWNWSTATTQTPMSRGANALTTGSLMSLSSSSAALNSTNGLLSVVNSGTSTSGVVAQLQSNGSAGSGLTVLANGNVGIGSATPAQTLDVNGNANISGTVTLPYGGMVLTRWIAGLPAVQPSTANTSGNVIFLPSGSATSSSLTVSSQAGYGGTNNSYLTQVNNNAYLRNSSVSGSLFLGTAGSNQMTFVTNGNVGITTTTPAAGLDVATTGTASSAIIVPRDTVANRPSAPVNGMIRYASDTSKLEAYQNGSWQNVLGGSASSLPLNGITSATAMNAIDNLNFAQTWTWSTATTQTPLSLSANGLTTGSGLAITSSSPSLGSTNGLLQVANTGTSTSGLLTRLQATGSAGAGLTVTNAGNVSIGTTASAYLLDVGTYNSTAALISRGKINEFATDRGVQIGYGPMGDSPRFWLGNGTSNWQIDNYNGVMRFFTPSNTVMQLGSTPNVLALNGGAAIGASYWATNSPPTNGMIVQGNVGIATTAPAAALDVFATGTAASAIIVPRDTTANRPTTPINGMIRYASDTAKFEAYQSGSWQNLIGGGSGGALSALTASTAANSIDNLNFSQTWNWSTATTQTGLLHAANALTTGSVLSLTSTSPSLNTTGGLLNVAYTGTSTTGAVLRVQANSSSFSALTVAANGLVGINTATPGNTLHVNGGITANGDISPSRIYPTSTSMTFPGYAFNVSGAGNSMGMAYITQNVLGFATNGLERIRIDASGNVGLGSTSPGAILDIWATGTANSALIVPRDTVANRPSSPINGMIRYASDTSKFEAYQNGSWQNLIGGGGGGSLSALTAATTTNTIDNLLNAQNWTWSTATTQTPLTVSANALTTASMLSLSSSSPSLNSSGGLLNVVNTGTSTSGLVARVQANSAAASGLTVLANGNVGVGSTSPVRTLDVNGTLGVGGLQISNLAGSLSLPSSVYFGGATFTGLNPSGSSLLQFNGYNGTVNSVMIGVIADGLSNRLRIGNYDAATATPQFLTVQNVSGGTSNVAGADFTFNGSQGTGTGVGGGFVFNTAPAGASGSTQNPEVAALTIAGSGKVGVGTGTPAAALDVVATGTTSALIVPRDTTANRPTTNATNGMVRYNTTANAMEAYVNGAWMQLSVQPVGSTANVTASGPPVSAGIYSYTATANYTPAFGALTNINNGVWPANGTSTGNNASCVNLRDTTTSPQHTITLDLGSTKTINKIYTSLETWGGAMYLGITFSTDGNTFTNSTGFYTAPGSNLTTTYTVITLGPGVSARYMRLTNMVNTGSGYYQNETVCQFAVGP